LRLLIQHRSVYHYQTPATLGPHIVRLRPSAHTRAKIESYGLLAGPEAQLRWHQDPYGNHVAHVTFPEGFKAHALELRVELALEVRPVNPFDFFMDERCKTAPFTYPGVLGPDLAPFLSLDSPALAGGKHFRHFLSELPKAGDTVALMVEINRAVQQRLRYVIRDEPGIWTPEQTLSEGRGSCRDSAALLIAALRSRGLAARFVSGYLIQLTDEGMIPDMPRGVGRDVVDLHAWTEVYLPGAGWIGLDSTSGLLCGEGHIPLACSASPSSVPPIEGTADQQAHDVLFEMKVGRLGHEPRPTRPYSDEVWESLLAQGDAADARLAREGVTLTLGGEPTFNSREHAEAPEWNTEALGPTKWLQGLRLAGELRRRLSPGAAVLSRFGKHYPGESLPRWSLDLYGRRDGLPVWTGELGEARVPATSTLEELAVARRFAGLLLGRLKLSEGLLMPAFEDPWRFFQDEARLPLDVDPLQATLTDPEERRRLSRVLERGLAHEAGYVLPLTRKDGVWQGSSWTFRRGRLYLLQGDSPIGLRLPIASLPPGYLPTPVEPEVLPPDPRRPKPEDAAQARIRVEAPSPPAPLAVRTALCVEVRQGNLYVFLPPLASCEDFFALLREVDAVRQELGLNVLLEGYPPPADPELFRLAVTPDPGVLEVNLPPTRNAREYTRLIETVFDAGLHAGLHAEKFLLDGRVAGSGGGHHLTLGGPSPLQSPFVQRPELLASLLTFVQHHPSLSYMFTGLFVGPTSQAPRLDEARHDALYELEIALSRAFRRDEGPPPPWLSDALFRHLLVDVSGNTHRTEISIDKLFDWRSPYGRQGLIELRAFEMPPHPRMAVAQMLLVRNLIASFAAQPYSGRLVRWGTALHDRFLLPHWMWQDFKDVLAHLDARGFGLPEEAYRPFVDLRCPVVGRLPLEGITLELRNAIEPWHVLGEEPTGTGTSRFVDSSMERVELRAEGLVPERHRVLVNGMVLPLRPTGTSGEAVAGVRFRAWAPPHSLHPHLGIHHPLRFDVLDTWGHRSLGACAYHVWHPKGRAFDQPPLTRFEAMARQSQRFTQESPLHYPVRPLPSAPDAEGPYTLDLRRYALDHPMPEPTEPSSER